MKKINIKTIKDLCGNVSFKKGEAFLRANKVVLEEYTESHWKGIVKGREDFHVSIFLNDENGLTTICTCPKLSSFQKECQHVGAVLLAIYEREKNSKNFVVNTSHEPKTTSLQSIFPQHTTRPIGEQRRFENRKVMEIHFLCSMVTMENGKQMIALGAEIDGIKVQDIRKFLTNIRNGNSYNISSSFTFDAEFHCFTREDESVILKLIQIVQDETLYMDKIKISDTVIIPPSSWSSLIALLKNVSLKLDGQQLTISSTEIMPLSFHFQQANNNSYTLHVEGWKEVTLMQPYSIVLFKSRLFVLEVEDSKLLDELIKLVNQSYNGMIHIPISQVSSFLEKVVPRLRKLGTVNLSNSFTSQLKEAGLIGKLYLDRVKNRLLIGLEFQYDNIVIDPFDKSESTHPYLLVRDTEKENEILKVLVESGCVQTEGGFYLHNEDLEYEFLYYIVPKLQNLVQIYATTAVRNRIFKGNAKPKIRVKVNKDRTNWLDFKFTMDGISEDEIRGLLLAIEEKRKYYRLRNGSLFSLETKEVEEIHHFLTTIPDESDIQDGISLPITKVARTFTTFDQNESYMVDSSVQKLIKDMQHPPKQFAIPNGLNDILRDYQKLGFNWMKQLASLGFGGILADDMGLGKTLQSITYICSELKDIRKLHNPVLIVCPSSLTYNWLAEISKFAPDIQAIVVDGDKKGRKDVQQNLLEYDVLITSYPLLRMDLDWYRKQQFHTIFFDEAQAFKNATTQTARAAKQLQATHRFALTGTPVENSPEELWSIFHIVFPELFQGLTEFSYLNSNDIAKRIRPFLLRRLKGDVLTELPDKNESIELVELSKDQKELYAGYLAKLRHDTFKHLDKETLRKNKIKILAGLTRLRQICCHPALFIDGYKGSSSKLEELLEIIDECTRSGRRVLIFSQFTKMLDIIGKRMTARGLPYFYLDGQTKSEDRLELVNRFNSGERAFFLISLKAGGTGLNLTGADTVILYDSWWNPAVEDQAMDRAHRIGQSREVQVIKLVARGTIEEKINELQEKKKQMIEQIIETEEKRVWTFTEEEIRDILNI